MPHLGQVEIIHQGYSWGERYLMQKEIKVQGRSGGDVGCVCGFRSHERREWKVRLQGALNVNPRRTHQGDSEVVYRSPQLALQHWFPPSLNEWSLWGHPALHRNQLWVRT